MQTRYVISEIWPKETVSLIFSAVDWGIEFLGITNPKITCNIKLLKGTNASTHANTAKLKSRRFEIIVNHKKIPSTQDDILKTIFHELTHVKQFIKDGLMFKEKEILWKNNSYQKKKYWFTPWEMEARAMEEAMLYYFSEEYL